ncbi:DUF3857 domain-containing protein [Algibacter sp. 2305UL17-15]|uniref:DUF3857 domain-containing protein n=1 Tax=Algibacter sp. 2305UL17-15 TaxID=3231268 RepID=UPI00345A9779
MNLKNSIGILVLFVCYVSHSQDLNYTSLTIPENLKKNANAVIRSDEVNVVIKSIDEMVITKKRVITVLNGKGKNSVRARVRYDDGIKIRTLQALVFNSFGVQIKKIRKNDFRDVSAVSGGTLYSDSRLKYLDYTPVSYPYTIEFISEIETNNTAFIPRFFPLQNSYVSVESSSYGIEYPEQITLRKKENNLEGVDVTFKESEGLISYQIKNMEAFEPESYSPSFSGVVPNVFFASKQFSLEGVNAEVETWDDFGKWMYKDLIKDAYDLPVSTIEKIKDLVKNEKDDIEKAKKIYQYVQDKTRYISVQVGIGGWKPYSASYVDRLGYGDCKALTNYTMSLLKAVGIESNYTVLYAGDSQMNIDKDFTSIQGNHVCLSIPTANETIWLECTSQKSPFGFIGDFTDDRDVLVITPEGGKIKHTKKYTTEENTQILKGNYSISNEGDITAHVQVSSKGIQYDDKFNIENYDDRDRDMAYKKRWRYINNISFDAIVLENDKDSIQFTETLSFTAKNYTKNAGTRMLFSINALNRNRHVPDRYRKRTLPVKVKRGFVDKDNVTITLPEGYKIESLPKNKTIENKFGSYKTKITVQGDNTLNYKREFIVKDGEYPKEDYTKFRAFYKEVSKMDNAKIALIKK